MLGIEDSNIDARLGTLGHGAASAAGATAAGMGGNGGSAGTAQGGSAGTSGAGGHDHHAASGTGGSDAGSAGNEDVPEPGTGGSGGTGGTSTHSAGGTQSGSGSAGKSSDEHGGASGDDGGPSADPCDDYCDEMQSECTGEAEQYRDRAQCIKICHFFPVGDDDSDENSVACRLKYVKKTQYGLGAEVTNYCRQAGPSGDGKCGTSCEAFCSVMMEVCTQKSAGANHFESTAACLETCDALPAATVHYSNNDPAVSDGNHALCRLFHVNSAAMADELEHCEHAMGITLCQATP
jgi:hypothetical protein